MAWLRQIAFALALGWAAIGLVYVLDFGGPRVTSFGDLVALVIDFGPLALAVVWLFSPRRNRRRRST